MSKVAIVYWSGTGNTASMAESVADGVKSKGGEAELFECSGFGADMLDNFDAVAFGCPAMGAETLEEDEFEPLFADFTLEEQQALQDYLRRMDANILRCLQKE